MGEIGLLGSLAIFVLAVLVGFEGLEEPRQLVRLEEPLAVDVGVLVMAVTAPVASPFAKGPPQHQSDQGQGDGGDEERGRDAGGLHEPHGGQGADRGATHAGTEHAQRQGPADADTVRRLVLEEAWEWAAFRRLAAQGQPAAADQCAYQATLIKARLAVLVGVPVEEMDEVTVVLRAEALADMLERLTAEDAGHAWAMDPWQRLNGVQACRNGGGLRRWRRAVSPEDWHATLLES